LINREQMMLGSRVTEDMVVEIEVERLKEFPNHPFKVVADGQMVQLIESIRKYGILSPLIVRPVPDGFYEIISGHRRKYAAQNLGYRSVPVIIRIMEDDEAVVTMVDSNLHRVMIPPSEKANAYKMKYDALKRTGGRKKGGQMDYRYKGMKTVEIVGSIMGDGPRQVQRWLKITELIPELQAKLDVSEIGFRPATELAWLKEEEQRWLLSAMEYTQSSPSMSQALRIKKSSQEGTLTEDEVKEILSEVKKGEISRVEFKNEQLYRFFPRDYTPAQMKKEILQMLQWWAENMTEGGKQAWGK